MNELMRTAFGEGDNLEWWQMAARAALIFSVALLLIRASGKRAFGLRSPFDNAMAILLGSILSRAVVGASPMIPTLAASFAIVILHRITAWLSLKSHWFGSIVKGKKVLLYKDGRIDEAALRRNFISDRDFAEGIRSAGGTESLDNIEAAYLERNGQISVIMKGKD